MRLWTCLILALSIVFASCSGKKINESDPAAMMQAAEEDIKSDNYLMAIEKLKVVRNKFGYSKYAADAQLRLADVYFMQENYVEAASAYETFRDLHPKHEKTPYAMLRIAESYFNDIPGVIARDLTPAQKAEDAYRAFLSRYPNDPQAELARTSLAKSRQALAQKELYIGNFYYKQEQYESAKRRYEKILSLYSDTPQIEEARRKLEKTLSELSKKKSST